MSKLKLYPLDIWEADGAYYSKGHHAGSLFVEAVWQTYGLRFRPDQIIHKYARVAPPQRGEDLAIVFCEPGPGAFPVTYWER